ncbi:hypothetical protein ABZX77_09745 [Streptomyces sp. NPDC004237]|uniref:hypothetical protein n=1 Tax=Streptomyces sp. NPDC004237 TaxID=3154455 RepID=UPI0033A13197
MEENLDLKVNPGLIISFTNGGARAHLPALRKRYNLNTAALNLLLLVTDGQGTEMRKLRESYDSGSIDQGIQRLLDLGIVVEAGDRARGQETVEEWREWGRAAGFFISTVAT